MTADPKPDQQSTEVVDPTSRCVVSDLGCRKCGYNLRTLHEDGQCPECGALVGLSTRGDLLQYSTPEWLMKLVTGLRLNVWATIASMVVSLIFSLVVALLAPLPVAVTGSLNIVFIVVGIWAMWLITEPAPTETQQSSTTTIRKSLRAIAVVGGVLAFIDSALSAIDEINGNVPVYLLIGASLLGQFVNQVGFVLCFLLFRQFSLRIPNERMARTANILKMGSAISLLALFIFMALVQLVGLPTPAIVIIGLPSVLGSLVFLIWAIIFTFRLIGLIKAELRLARQHWAPPEGSIT